VAKKKHSAPSLLDDLPEEPAVHLSDPKAIRKKAMDFLARREYGCGELEKKLINAGYETAIVAEEVGRLASEGLQSDERFAESFIQSRINQGKGPVRIRQDLKERGLGSAAIDSALSGCGADWHELAREVRRRKFGGAVPREFRERARQMRFLQYRGFDMPQIQAAVGDDGFD
jgi:regulatory protein